MYLDYFQVFAVVKNAVTFFVVNFQHVHDCFLRIILKSRVDGLLVGVF